MDLKKNLDELNQLIVQFQFEQALDKFYHNDDGKIIRERHHYKTQ
jgi:hypothetical protein